MTPPDDLGSKAIPLPPYAEPQYVDPPGDGNEFDGLRRLVAEASEPTEPIDWHRDLTRLAEVLSREERARAECASSGHSTWLVCGVFYTADEHGRRIVILDTRCTGCNTARTVFACQWAFRGWRNVNEVANEVPATEPTKRRRPGPPPMVETEKERARRWRREGR